MSGGPARRDFLSDHARAVDLPAERLARQEQVLRSGAAGLTDLYSAGNYVALVLVRTGRVDEAMALCRTQLRSMPRIDSTTAAVVAFDPELNLCRIAALQRDTDGALEGLARLIRVVDSEAVDFADWTWDPASAAVMPRRALVASLTALRNGVVWEICKVLWRAGRLDELRTAADDFARRWPRAAAHGLHAPHEALTLIARAPITPAAELARLTGEELRLGFVQELHRLAAQPTDELADDLLGRLERVAEGDLVCPTTPAVWRVDLAASLRGLGRTAEAMRLVEEVLPTAASTYDLTLHSRLRREFPAVAEQLADPAGDPAASGEQAGRHALLVTAMLNRLQTAAA